ncbi:MAG: ABC transporter permease [Eubacterium sp.]|nr:ABC transporter permease [Eubacterium sp.]
MFGRLFKARIKLTLRSKKYMFWTLFFPLALGTLFYFAFNSIYSSIQSEPIPVVVEVNDSALEEYKVLQAFSMLDKDKMQKDLEDYYTEKATAEAMGEDFDKAAPINEDDLETLENIESFDDVVKVPLSTFNKDYLTGDPDTIKRSDLPIIQVLEDLEYENGTKMVEEISCDSHEKAEKLLTEGDIAGIITVNSINDVKLLVNGEGVNHSILSNIISKYLYQVNLTIDRMNENPEENSDVEKSMDLASFDLDYVSVRSLGGENKDPFVTYFYNLLSMICVMGSTAALYSTIDAQANQSDIGIRIDGSAVSKALLEIANLLAVALIQIFIILITITYLMFGLGINFGGNTLMIYLTLMAASTVGTSLGYFMAHIGSFKAEIKEALMMVVILGGSFLSGLMYGDMKSILEEKCPIVNRINPCAVITDSLLSLNLFGVGKVYYRSMMYILILDVVMLTIGIILSNKRSYKSL